jgi:hypothetical protein
MQRPGLRASPLGRAGCASESCRRRVLTPEAGLAFLGFAAGATGTPPRPLEWHALNDAGSLCQGTDPMASEVNLVKLGCSVCSLVCLIFT